MKCKRLVLNIVFTVIVALGAIVSLSCNEHLPVYAPPAKVLDLSVGMIEQLNDHVAPPGRQMVHVVLVSENIYDEVFQDSVNIKGSVRIWWKRKPSRFRTIYLTEKNFISRSLIHNRKLMILPGQQVTFDFYWDIRSDDGVYLPSEMDISEARKRVCATNVYCYTPEVFVIEASLSIYDRLGYISAPAKEFTFVGRICRCGAYPPCVVAYTGGDC
jgi:hypothetical protein